MKESSAEPVPPGLQPLLRYWEQKRGDRRMPRRADIEPSDLVPYLPCMMIVDVVADVRRYVYRLVGTREVEMRGHDPTGRPVLEAFLGAGPEEVFSNYDRVVESRAPHVDTETVVTTENRLDDSEVIFLPLSEDGETVSQILVYTVFDPRPETR
jgi:hypothetical protein